MYKEPLSIDHLSWFVRGAYAKRDVDTNQKSPISERFIWDNTRGVLLYLQGKKTLDGTCSDTFCDIAAAAMKVFGPQNPDY